MQDRPKPACSTPPGPACNLWTQELHAIRLAQRGRRIFFSADAEESPVQSSLSHEVPPALGLNQAVRRSAKIGMPCSAQFTTDPLGVRM